ncbi:MAG: copper resistance protein NlpE [Bacteroides sp.]|nr:copper resistance protein NlpE [Bacteroides sp.]
MRKMVLSAAALAMLTLAACSGDKACGGDCKKGDSKDMIYTGLLPAADVDGIRYTLKLDYDDDNGGKSGDYDLVEVYITGDSLSATGYKDAARFKSEGDFTVINGEGANSANKYIKLVEDTKGAAASNTPPTYFLIESDTTLVMVNSDLERSQMPGLNYTLKLVK